jgi:hypothetical protein
LFYWVDNKFGGTKPKNMVFVVLDPDGKAKDAARANGRSKGVQIHLYHNGQVTSQRNARTDTDGFWGGQYIHQYNGPVWTPRPEWDPLWLKY